MRISRVVRQAARQTASAARSRSISPPGSHRSNNSLASVKFVGEGNFIECMDGTAQYQLGQRLFARYDTLIFTSISPILLQQAQQARQKISHFDATAVPCHMP
jgi:hypothetical protein